MNTVCVCKSSTLYKTLSHHGDSIEPNYICAEEHLEVHLSPDKVFTVKHISVLKCRFKQRQYETKALVKTTKIRILCHAEPKQMLKQAALIVQVYECIIISYFYRFMAVDLWRWTHVSTKENHFFCSVWVSHKNKLCFIRHYGTSWRAITPQTVCSWSEHFVVHPKPPADPFLCKHSRHLIPWFMTSDPDSVHKPSWIFNKTTKEEETEIAAHQRRSVTFASSILRLFRGVRCMQS